MYLELSRPVGDTSRWEKVLKRLTLLNKNYPLSKVNCEKVDFQREMTNKDQEDIIYTTVQNALINQGVVFFGGFAISLYSKYMPRKLQHKLEKIADFDVLSNEPKITSEIIKERLKDVGINNVKIIEKKPVGDIIPEHYEIKIGTDTIAFIYKPNACHSYNMIDINGQKVKIATIDTMLSFYLAFLYADRPYYNEFLERILCMSKFLFEVQQKNRLEQKGLLKRFSITCYGHQETIEEMRAHKSEKYKELKNQKNKKEYEEWFLNYKPEETNKKEKKTTSERQKTTSENNKEKKDKKTIKKKAPTKKKAPKKKSIFQLYGQKTRKNKKDLY